MSGLPPGAMVKFSLPIDELGPMPWPLDISLDGEKTWRRMTAEERSEYDRMTDYMFTRKESP